MVVMTPKVKICGITNLEDAQASIKAGCDGIGFIFYKPSPRYIAPVKARDIIRRLATNIPTVGVFVNAREKTVKRIAGFCGLDILQFHGNESPEFCARFKKYKIIKAFRVKDTLDREEISRYDVFALLFDAFSVKKMGGTGRKFDWRLISRLSGIKKPIFLSGGLSEKNVSAAIRSVRPRWVDASSSLEVKPGKKDHGKVKRFIRAVKRQS